MSKKVLIVAYYWPPAGGPGVQRWLKFTKYLPDFGVKPIVYVPSNPNYPLRDESLLAEVSNELTVIKQPINEPYKWAKYLSNQSTKSISKGLIPDKNKQSLMEKLMLVFRGNFFIPDARKKWVKPSVKYLTTYIKDHAIDTVITTGPPHSLHLIGLQLKQNINVKWIADFRDPWTTIGYHKALRLSKSSMRKHENLEKQVLNSADQIVVTSHNTKLEFIEKTSKPIEVITNGYDDERIEHVVLDDKFSMSHIGSLLSERNPEVLWKVLNELISENSDFASEFQLNLVGAVSPDILNVLDSYGLNSYINNIGYVSHLESVKFQKQSQVLLLIEIDSEETKCIIPGKLFEYLASNRPIIAIGPKASDVESIIQETNTGEYFYYTDHQRLKIQILNYYNTFREQKLQVNAIGLQKFSRKELTKKLITII